MNSFDLRGYLSNNPLLNEATDPKAEQIIKAVMRRYGRTREQAIEDLVDMDVLDGGGYFKFIEKTKFKGTSDEYKETVEDKIASYYRNNDIEVADSTQDIPDIKADFEIEDEEDTIPQEEPQEEEPLQGPEGDVSDLEDKNDTDAYQNFLGDKEEIEIEKTTVERLTDIFKDQGMSDKEAKDIANEMLEEYSEEDLKGILYAMVDTQEVEDLPAEVEAQELEQAQDTIQELQPELEQALSDLDSLKSDLDSLTGNDELSGTMGSVLDSLSGGTGTGQGVATDGPGGEGGGNIGFNFEGFEELIMILIGFLFSNFLNKRMRKGVEKDRDRRNLRESKIEMLVQERLDEQRLTESVIPSLGKKYKDLISKYKGRSAEAGAKAITAFVEDFKQTKSLPSSAKKFFKVLTTNLVK